MQAGRGLCTISTSKFLWIRVNPLPMIHLPFQDRCDVVPFEQISDVLDQPKAWSIDQQHCHVYSCMPSATHLKHSPLKQSGRQWHLISSSAWWRVGCVCQYRLVVSVNKSHLINCNAQHPQLVLQPTNIFSGLLHCKKITPKGACFTGILLRWVPINRSIVQENDESCPRSPSHQIASVITVDKYSHRHWRSARFRHIVWEFLLLGAIISVCWIPPVLLTKQGHIRADQCQIENHLRIRMCLQICKDVVQLLKVSTLR